MRKLTAALRLEASFWRPAFIVAAAWRDIEARLGELGGDSPRTFDWSAIGASLLKAAAGCLDCRIIARDSAKEESVPERVQSQEAENELNEWEGYGSICCRQQEGNVRQMLASQRLQEESATCYGGVVTH